MGGTPKLGIGAPAVQTALEDELRIVRSRIAAAATIQQAGNIETAFTVEVSTWKTLA